MKKLLFFLSVLIAIVLFFLAGCGSGTPTLAPQPAVTKTPTVDPLDQYLNQKVDLAPRVIETRPAIIGFNLLSIGCLISKSGDRLLLAGTMESGRAAHPPATIGRL